MKEKTVKRFYCDHCRKGMFKRDSMLSHEANCIMNPKRTCYLCTHGIQVDDFKALADEFKKRDDVVRHDDADGNETDFYTTDSQLAIDWLSGKCHACPACILAVLKQGKVLAFEVFDYKEKVAEWHQEQSREFRGLVS